MKQVWAVIFSVVIFGLFSGNALGGPEVQKTIGEGFAGIDWGTNINQLDGFEKAYSKDNVDYYLSTAKEYCLKDGNPVPVIYGFYTNKFFAAFINFESIEDYTQVKKYVREKYGNPDREYSTKSDQIVDKWKDSNVKIKLKMNTKTDKMKFAVYYLPLSVQINEEQQESFQETKIEVLPTIKRKEKPMGKLPLLSF